MFKKFNDLLRRFNKSKDGNFAVTAALLGVPVMVGAMGLAVDYSQGVNSRSHMQSALDAAVWRVGQLDPDNPNKLAEMQKYYTANGGLGTVEIKAFDVGTKFVKLQAQATYDMATSLTGIVGLKAVRITTSSTAQLPFRLTSATFEVTKQQGWWAKSIYLYGRIEGQSSYRKLLRLQYGGRKVASSGAYTTGNYPNQAWIYSQSDVSNLAKTEVPSDVNPVVNLENIDSLYVEITIDAADAGIKQAFFNDYASTKLFSMARVFQSDDPVYVKRMYITKGGITKQNDRTDIYARLRCGEVERHRWEDGGSLKRVNQTINNKVVSVVQEGDYAVKTKTDSSPELSSGYTINDAAGIADFEYEVTGRCGYTTGDARLTQ